MTSLLNAVRYDHFYLPLFSFHPITFFWNLFTLDLPFYAASSLSGCTRHPDKEKDVVETFTGGLYVLARFS